MIDRRNFLRTGSVSALSLLTSPLLGATYKETGPALSGPEINSAPRSLKDSRGSLVIIGGAEDRKEDMVLLHRFVELCGKDPSIVVVTAASAYQDDMWKIYDAAFRQLGVTRLIHLEVSSRLDANSTEMAATILDANGVFMTGGDQQRLMSTLGGTRTAKAIYDGFKQRGICVAGTSAGAAVMAAHMIAEGRAKGIPERGLARMSAGMGFVEGAIIDQHFSQRQRLGRLLSLVAQAPFLLGVGIDENTALVIKRGEGLEVIGDGAVTIVDGRNMVTNFFEVRARDLLELLNVRLHLLPSGARYNLPDPSHVTPDSERSKQKEPVGSVPASLLDVVTILADF